MVLDDGMVAAILEHDVWIVKFGAVSDFRGKQACWCSCAEVIGDIKNCSRAAYSFHSFVNLEHWRAGYSFDISTASQEAGKIFTFTAFSAADIIVDDLSGSSQADWFVAYN